MSPIPLIAAFFAGLVWSFRKINVSAVTMVAVAACGSVAYWGLFYLGREVVHRSERQTSVVGRLRELLLFILLAIVNMGLWAIMFTFLSTRSVG